MIMLVVDHLVHCHQTMSIIFIIMIMQGPSNKNLSHLYCIRIGNKMLIFCKIFCKDYIVSYLFDCIVNC